MMDQTKNDSIGSDTLNESDYSTNDFSSEYDDCEDDCDDCSENDDFALYIQENIQNEIDREIQRQFNEQLKKENENIENMLRMKLDDAMDAQLKRIEKEKSEKVEISLQEYILDEETNSNRELGRGTAKRMNKNCSTTIHDIEREINKCLEVFTSNQLRESMESSGDDNYVA
mmetsp:Transcript_19232/g.23668  ORF Transcript_19232/g.23668 Transcript_19232/m.23668 type:complete len:172 (+) Transcript_19232:231-746(+)